MKVIIDADSISYLLGWGFKDLDQSITNHGKVLAATDQFMLDLLTATRATEYVGFLGGVHATFRHLMNKDYKSNRGLTKPDWWNQWGGVINHRLRNFWKFYYVEGIEAEDAVSMIASYYTFSLQQDVIIAHIDKDLMQIPGGHYNFKTQVSSEVTDLEASKSLFKQVLMGDSTDNVPGLVGCGKQTADKILANGNTPTDFMMLALNKFITVLGEREGIIKFTESYAMVKLLDVPPPDLNFAPVDYVFLKAEEKIASIRSVLDTEEKEEKEHDIDNSQYFVQQDNLPEKEDQ